MLKTGEYVSEQLSFYILRNVTQKEVSKIAKECNFSPEQLRKMLNGSRAITDKNKNMLILIIKLAIKNRNRDVPILRKTHNFYSKNFKK